MSTALFEHKLDQKENQPKDCLKPWDKSPDSFHFKINRLKFEGNAQSFQRVLRVR